MPKNEGLPKLDSSIIKYYSQGKEKDRLNTAQLEKDRTLQILRKSMPPAPAIVLDIGGAYGVYAFPLAEKGYEVHLIDPVPVHIEQAHEYAKNFPSVKLASYSVGEARKIDRPDKSVDVILFFGPLYHLAQKKDRLLALNEAYRVLKPNGILFAAAISRFTSLIDNINKGEVHSKLHSIEQDILTGLHPSENSKTLLYFHRPNELKEELHERGFNDVSLLGIEGPVWFHSLIEPLQHDTQGWQKLLSLLDMIEREESIIGSSAHIMAIAKKGSA